MKNSKLTYEEEIIQYYDDCEVAYRDVWDLENSMAMHYGYWDKSTKKLSDALRKMNEVLSDFAGFKKGSKILDAGCGVGGSSIFLAQKYQANLVGISLSKLQCEKAQANSEKAGTASQTEFQIVDYNKTPFVDNSFDGYWAMESLCHAADKRLALKEAFRVLKPGGIIALSDGFLFNREYNAHDRETLDKWVHNWSIQDLESLENMETYAKEIGFEDVKYLDITPYIRKSARRLGILGRLALNYGNLLRLLGKSYGNESQVKNTIGAIYQHKAMQKGLWRYGIFVGRKAQG